MYRKFIKILIFAIAIAFVVWSFKSCMLVDGYTKFPIEGFEEFYDLESPEVREKYINSGQLDFSKKEDVYFLPFIKEGIEEECIILLNLYSEDTDNKVTLDKISLVDSNGDVIALNEEYGEAEVLSEWSSSMSVVDTFQKSEDWFYSGNNLTLHIEATITNGNKSTKAEFSYNASIVKYRGPAWQV